MLYDNDLRKSLINKVVDQLHNAQIEAEKLADFKIDFNQLNKRLIEFSQEVIELWRKNYSQREYGLYKERLQQLIGMHKHQVSKAADQSRSRNTTKKLSKPSSENEISSQTKVKYQSGQEQISTPQQMQILKEDDFSDISFASLTSSNSETIQEIIEHSEKNVQGFCQVHNCRELKIIREIFRQKIDINELQMALEEITSLKSQIRMKLQKENQKIQVMHERLIEGQNKLKRMEEYEKDQSKMIMLKKIALNLE
ncbi:unnamed protein product (macronuclear) [Paramecium tetraurelia]|uniref:Uncharacterized protein n=1 Tax=Paramecium tetraurelia TaxID=5888 RepID=A0BW68_PARTE|nr:uncharacterized protein GSPATT00032637001 [Paramecium tetraurelia]CAK62785.1 unnamed protein product [Paramecium tetraurelia]|eukprot:XP_001430183.1 hypothetical protein (macronuclear) [Paramecium tetraurelia strain d4-2]